MLSSQQIFLIRIPVILLALTVHEYAHGYVAWLRGDTTAKQAGRLTLNPFAHLDIFGTLMLFFGPFGWAKPVPVNVQNLDNPRRDIVYVSLAGPAANIILAVALGYAYRGLSAWVGESPLYPYDVLFLRLSVLINIGLSFFNLIPIPPLDGSKIFMGLIPPARVASYINIVRHVPKIFLLLILVEWGFHVPVLSWLLDPLWNPYLAFWQFVIFGGKVM